MSNLIKHVSLDVWQTLINSNAAFRKKRNDLVKDHFKIDLSIDKLSEIIKDRQAWCTHANQVVGKNIDSFEIILLILQDCGQSIDGLTGDSFSLFYNEMEKLFFDFPPLLIEENLSSLFSTLYDKEIGISLLSNTGLIKGQTLRNFFSREGLNRFFHFELYSDEIGFSKPNIKAFEKVYEMASSKRELLPSEVIHIGDNKIADHGGALSFGFQARLIDHAHVTLNKIFATECT